ncbi:MAG: hemin-degrading factor [Gammaproteobacteria bacterium]|nr:hemin-degrading factor [Gammaproteobacteria bacterium]
MEHAAKKSSDNLTSELKSQYQLLKQRKPGIRARNAAGELGVPEGSLLAAHVGTGTTRLADNVQAILKSVLTLGEVMALTRNESCVHERKGIYDNCHFFSHGKKAMGLFLNPDIDLRLFLEHWKYCFSTIEQGRSGVRKSLQFFDKAGQAIHKIYLTPKSNTAAYETLIAKHRHARQDAYIEVEAYEKNSSNPPYSRIDWEGLRMAWKNLKDTHDFKPMLRQFGVGREQALEGVGQEFAYQVMNDTARRVLEQARDRQCEIMVFVGNRGCIQIHTGVVKKLVEHGPWYNVLDSKFNLHLREDQIARTWVTKKPTEDGVVTALEVFDKDSELIAMFFGKRKPGIPELDLWREVIADLT